MAVMLPDSRGIVVSSPLPSPIPEPDSDSSPSICLLFRSSGDGDGEGKREGDGKGPAKEDEGKVRMIELVTAGISGSSSSNTMGSSHSSCKGFEIFTH